MGGKTCWGSLFLWLIGVATGIFFLAEWQYGDAWQLLALHLPADKPALNSRQHNARPDAATGEHQFTRAASQVALDPGQANALYRQGLVYWLGDGVPQDKEKGFSFLRQAAENNHANAQVVVGVALFEGTVIQEDPAAALSLFERAAAAGNADALFNLGELYRHGAGVRHDASKAAEYYSQAAAHGHAGAQERAASYQATR